MKRSNGQDLPRARKDNLVTRQVPGELLVYDLKRHKAFCLNSTAAEVWKGCNGKRSVTDLARSLEKDSKSRVDEKIVWLALDQLEKSNLLREKTVRPASALHISRRGLIRAGLATAIALPVVIMISAPTAQAAGTPITQAACQARHQSDLPGNLGCIGSTNPCLAPATGTCINDVGNTCKCG
jgi:hypothetical protein